MATASRLTDSPLGKSLQQEAPEFHFLQAIRLLQNAMAIPQDQLPVDQVKFIATNRQDFHPSMLESIEENQGDKIPQTKGRTDVTINGFSITGQQGPLPSAHSIWLMSEASKGNTGPMAFINLFNHRLIALRYLQEAQLNPMLFNQKPEEHYLYQCLSGINSLELSHMLPKLPAKKSDLAAFSGLLNGSRINQSTMAQLLSAWLPYPVEIKQFQGGWQKLPADRQTGLSTNVKQKVNNRLNGMSALGRKVWDNAQGIFFDIGPVSYKNINDFLPNSEHFNKLINILSLLTSGRYMLHIAVRLNWKDIPPSRFSRRKDEPDANTPETEAEKLKKEKLKEEQLTDYQIQYGLLPGDKPTQTEGIDKSQSETRLLLGSTSWLKSRFSINGKYKPTLKYVLKPKLNSLTQPNLDLNNEQGVRI
ncbi:type VI secretion system baseplate subunit TssG [Aliikangiella coralliicola]|uniref:Type VI secretion system baseplate subunit TssG n=1 Tax=Aliikangiella coralliicola TaxID=2592383 RepID=A0A545UCS6_9GAMM|nr:type VI secretion system baseplate subunit TssG [Aliikangiella coralliicola]TQV87266.1 type VI secretion system baseplate subunit TssG [Aliikangiella coralliicola]